VDPLAKVMRKKLKDAGVKDLTCVYSTEQPKTGLGEPRVLGSVPYVPSVAGLILAASAVALLTEKKELL